MVKTRIIETIRINNNFILPLFSNKLLKEPLFFLQLFFIFLKRRTMYTITPSNMTRRTPIPSGPINDGSNFTK